jgi:hypothetical protein
MQMLCSVLLHMWVGYSRKITLTIFKRRGAHSLELNKSLLGRQIILWPPRNVTVVWWRSDRNFKQTMSATILVAGRDRRAIAAKDTNVRSAMYGTGSTFSGAAIATLWLVKSVVEGTESERFPSFCMLRLRMIRCRPTCCHVVKGI